MSSFVAPGFACAPFAVEPCHRMAAASLACRDPHQYTALHTDASADTMYCCHHVLLLQGPTSAPARRGGKGARAGKAAAAAATKAKAASAAAKGAAGKRGRKAAAAAAAVEPEVPAKQAAKQVVASEEPEEDDDVPMLASQDMSGMTRSAHCCRLLQQC